VKQPESIDAVELKNRIQAEIRKEQEGLSDEEVRKRRAERLATSDSPIAKWWRRITAAEGAASSVHEKPDATS